MPENLAFRRDKNHFFSLFEVENPIDLKIGDVDTRVETIGYSFLLQHQPTLESEFSELFVTLQQNAEEEVFWLYCYYCASLLEAFYRAYNQDKNADRFRLLRQEIKDRLHKVKTEQAQDNEDFIKSLQKYFKEGFINFVHSPLHSSQTKNNIGFANLCRIYGVFLRLTLIQGATVAKSLKLIEQLDLLLNTQINVDKFIATLKAPTFIFNIFSVGFFLARFMIDAGTLLRHTFFPSAAEKGDSCGIHYMKSLPDAGGIDFLRNSYILTENEEGEEELYYIPKKGKLKKLNKRTNEQLQALFEELRQKKSILLTAARIKESITEATDHKPEATTRFERFKFEIYKRYCTFLNDLVWAVVNFLSNFNTLVHISGAVAGYLTAAFLLFDVLMVLHRCQLAKKEYLIKKAQYLREIQDYENTNSRYLTDAQRLIHLRILRQQLQEHEVKWRKDQATFHFNAAAATLLMLGFTVSLLAIPAAAIVACYFVCTLAVAMFLSSGAYANLVEQNLRLEQAKLSGGNTAAAAKASKSARNHFIFTMTKNILMPLLLITTYAISWPAAILLTLMYLGYELFHAYRQHTDKKTIKQLAAAQAQDNESGAENLDREGLDLEADEQEEVYTAVPVMV